MNLIMERLRKSNLQLNCDKCEFLKNKVSYLEFFLISRYFGIGSVNSHFILLKFSLLDVKMRKKKERQTFRSHMWALLNK